MNLGAFSISLNVKNLEASKAFYEKLGFSQFSLVNQFEYMTQRLENFTSTYVENASREVDDTVDAGDGGEF